MTARSASSRGEDRSPLPGAAFLTAIIAAVLLYGWTRSLFWCAFAAVAVAGAWVALWAFTRASLADRRDEQAARGEGATGP